MKAHLVTSVTVTVVTVAYALTSLGPGPVRASTADIAQSVSAQPSPSHVIRTSAPKVHRTHRPSPSRSARPSPVRRITSSAVASPTPSPVRTYSPSPSPSPSVSSVPASSGAAKAVAYALAQLGCPYVYGGTGPCGSGFDCSGLTMEAWAAAGVAIPRTSQDQWAGLPHVSTSSLEPGDILVFYPGASHVGLYIGNGYMVDSSRPGVPVQKISIAGYYEQNMIGAVRP